MCVYWRLSFPFFLTSSDRKPQVVRGTDLLMEDRPWRLSIKVQGSRMGSARPFISRAQKPIVARFRVKCAFCAVRHRSKVTEQHQPL